MASLTNTKIKDTYDGLLKTTDNDALGGTYKLITDGLGNSSGLYLGTGGRLGLGTSFPTTPLEVVSSENTLLYLNSSTASVYLRLDDSNSTNGNYIGATTDDMHFWTNNTERMRIDSSGVVTIKNDLLLDNGVGRFTFQNASGVNDVYSTTTGFGAYEDLRISADNYIFRTGTTERMRINSSGNVGIGTNDPSTKLHVYESSSLDHITIDGNNGDNRNLRFATENSTRWNLYATGESETGSNVGSDLAIAKYTDAGAYNGNVLMIKRNTGNVGIGRIPTSHILEINGEMKIVGLGASEGIDAYNDASRQWGIKSTSAGTDSGIKFEVQDSERMRITSAGRIHFYNLLGSSATQSDVRYDTTSKEMFYNTSSERYKTEIVDLENTLDKVNSLRAVRYKDIETEQETTGLIAEEVIEIIPEVVFKKEIEGFDEPQPEGINYSDFAPFLIKAIQELKAEIETLKSQINS